MEHKARLKVRKPREEDPSSSLCAAWLAAVRTGRLGGSRDAAGLRWRSVPGLFSVTLVTTPEQSD